MSIPIIKALDNHTVVYIDGKGDIKLFSFKTQEQIDFEQGMKEVEDFLECNVVSRKE